MNCNTEQEEDSCVLYANRRGQLLSKQRVYVEFPKYTCGRDLSQVFFSSYFETVPE